MGDYYNFDNPLDRENSYSLSLVVSRQPVDKFRTLIALRTKANHD